MNPENEVFKLMLPVLQASLEQLKTMDPNQVIQGEHGSFTVQESIEALTEALKLSNMEDFDEHSK